MKRGKVVGLEIDWKTLTITGRINALDSVIQSFVDESACTELELSTLQDKSRNLKDYIFTIIGRDIYRGNFK